LALVIAAVVAAGAYPMVSPYHARLRAAIQDPAKRQAAIRQAIDFEKIHYRAFVGNKEAQYNLGLALSSGELGFKDMDQAVAWFQKSANQGYPLSEYAMAHYSFIGLGIRKDEADGASWTEKALETSTVPAARELMGLLLVGAIGEKQDMDQGLGYLKTGQTSDSLQLAMQMDAKFKEIYALPKEQRDAALQQMGKDFQANVRDKFSGIEKNLATMTLVAPPAPEAPGK
jgi:TPR repeat protein